MKKLLSTSIGRRIPVIVLTLLLLASTSGFANGDPEHWYPDSELSQSAYRGEARHVSRLIEEREDVNQRDQAGLTPLMWAALGAELRCATLLVKAAADVNVRDQRGLTALMLTSGVGSGFGFWVILPAKGPLSFIKDIFPIRAHTRVAELLIEAGADVEARDGGGRTALLFAAAGSDLDHVRFLLDRGADPDVRDNAGDTVLTAIAHTGFYSARDAGILRLLLSSGVDPNMQNESGWNALLLSCRQGNVEYVRALLEYRADVNVVTGDEEISFKDYTPLRFAEEGGHSRIVEMLKAAGATR